MTHTSGSATLRVAWVGSDPTVVGVIDGLDVPGGDFDVVARVDDPLDLPRDLEDGGPLAAVLLEVGPEPSEASLRQLIGVARATTYAPVILLTGSSRPEILSWAAALDVDDVLVLPQSPETVGFAVRKARRRALTRAVAVDAATKRGRVVTVFSPKGGTGKTVLTTNLAVSVATRTNLRVLLVDLDLQFGDAAIMLGVDPTRTLFTLVRDPGELDAGKLEAYVTKHRSGLDVLAAPVRPEEAELVTEQRVQRLLEVASDMYDLVFVDTSPFFYGPMLALLDPTDELYVLCGLDVPTLKNVAVSLRTLEKLGFSRSRTNLVLNRVAPDIGLAPEDVEKALGVSVRYEIPNDPVVARAVNRGNPAVLSDPESEFTAAVHEMAGGIAGLAAENDPVVETSTARRAWLSALRLLEGRTT